MKPVVLTAAALGLAACAAPSAPVPADLKQIWTLTQAHGFADARIAALNANMDWRELPQAGAYMGCNRLMFDVQTAEGGKIRFGHAASTLKYCAGNMDVEQSFAQTLPTFTDYVLQGKYLILRGEKGEWRFVAP